MSAAGRGCDEGTHENLLRCSMVSFRKVVIILLMLSSYRRCFAAIVVEDQSWGNI